MNENIMYGSNYTCINGVFVDTCFIAATQKFKLLKLVKQEIKKNTDNAQLHSKLIRIVKLLSSNVSWLDFFFKSGTRQLFVMKIFKDNLYYFFYANGDVYLGENFNNTADGYGVYFNMDGTVQHGLYRNGIRIIQNNLNN